MTRMTPDKGQARSIIEAATAEMRTTLSLEQTLEMAPLLLRSVYECFRSIGNALLMNEGIREMDHVPQIERVIKLPAQTPRPLLLLDNLRRLRHDINYRGHKPTQAELDEFMDFAHKCWKPVLEEAKKTVG